MPRSETLSNAQARRISLRANGFDAPRPTGRVDRRHLRQVVRRLGLVQIDSVNVCVRTQYLSFFSRLGNYDMALLDRMAYEDRELFEYWGHVASLVDVDLQPLLRWRMADPHPWNKPNSVANTQPGLVDGLEREVVDAGPLSAGDLEAERAVPKGPWWDWSHTKTGLEYLFWTGRIGALRRGNFERVYCAPADAVPPAVLDVPTPDHEEAKRALLMQAASAHGIATARDLADYWRQPIVESRRLLADLVADGSLLAVTVDGWNQPAFLHPDATVPRSVDACALVSPFDQVMWERDRVERLHDFRYRIEIYVPKPKREFGYYVLPFLLGDTFVARVDLKADRAGSRLLVQSAHAEAELHDRGTDEAEVAERLAAELRLMATWLGLDDVTIVGRGDLAPALTSAHLGAGAG